MDAGKIRIGTELDTKSFDKQIEDLEDKIEDLETQKIMFTNDKDTANLHKVNIELEKAKNKLVNLQHQQEKLNQTSKQTYDGIGRGVENVVKKVGRWALALVGIRSAYGFIRNSMSTLSQGDENLASQLEYISWTLVQSIKPIVDWIVNAVYVILQGVNSITQSLFNMKLFKGPDEFAKAMKSASGSAKQIQKTLAGFDEKNVLGTTLTGGGGASSVTPPFDTDSVINSVDKTSKAFKNLKKEMQDALNNPQLFEEVYGNWAMFFIGITGMGTGFLQGIQGVIDTIIGLFDILMGFLTSDKEKIEEGIDKLLSGITELLKGIFNFWFGLITTHVGLIFGLLSSIVKWIWDNVLMPIYNAIKQVVNWVWNNILVPFGGLLTKVGSMVTSAFSTAINFVKGLFNGLWDKAKQVLNWIGDKLSNIKDGLKETGEKLAESKVGKAVGKVVGGVKSLFGFAGGGIINNPGRGVPLSNAVGGEGGPEGIVPLSNAQAMEQLGEVIARNIVINLTNVTELDGNMLARKVTQVINNNNFTRNR